MLKYVFPCILLILFHMSGDASLSYCNDCIQRESYLPSGIYGGTDLGYAWILSPTENDDGIDFVDHDRGHFAWGVFGGYLLNLVDLLSVGVEIAYHDNGHSTLTYISHNRYKISSRDWDVLATIFYPLCQNFFITVKGGGARVRQMVEVVKKVDPDCADPQFKMKKWEPTVTIGCTTCQWGCLYPFFHYRWVFGRNQTSCDLKDIATIHSVYGGAFINF